MADISSHRLNLASPPLSQHCLQHCLQHNRTGALTARWEKVNFSFFTEVLKFTINFYARTMPWLIPHPPDWIWKHHLFPPHANNSKKQFPWGGGEILVCFHFLPCIFSSSLFFHSEATLSRQQKYPSPQTGSGDVTFTLPIPTTIESRW